MLVPLRSKIRTGERTLAQATTYYALDVRPPIFVWEPNDLLVFDSVEKAEAFDEPQYVDEGVTYDAEGRLLAFETDGLRTHLREREPEPRHEADLRTAIAQASLALGTEIDPAMPLEELVEAALARFRV